VEVAWGLVAHGVDRNACDFDKLTLLPIVLKDGHVKIPWLLLPNYAFVDMHVRC